MKTTRSFTARRRLICGHESRAMGGGLALVFVGMLTPLLGQSQWSNGTGGAIYYNGGKVGVGTSTPTAMLQIQAPTGSGSSDRLLSIKDSNGVEKLFIDGIFQYNGIQFQDSGPNAAFSLTDAGVGLSLRNSAHITWSSDGTFFGPQDIGLYRNAAGVLEIYDGVNAGNIRDLRVRAINPTAGNVGIGTTNPQYKLAVNGTVGAKEVVVTNTGWADYVFAPDYQPVPLEELARYIKEHHQLPGIPSEAEVQANGVSLGEMQVTMLAKIEELTLYLVRSEETRRERLERFKSASHSWKPL